MATGAQTGARCALVWRRAADSAFTFTLRKEFVLKLSELLTLLLLAAMLLVALRDCASEQRRPQQLPVGVYVSTGRTPKPSAPSF